MNIITKKFLSHATLGR